jgi:sugar diacid utilization regulator
MGRFKQSEYETAAKKENAEEVHKKASDNYDFGDHIFTEMVDHFSKDNIYAYKSAISVMGYNLDSKRMAILVQLSGFRDYVLESPEMMSIEREDLIKKWKRKVEEALNAFFSRNTDIIVAYVGDENFLVLKSIEENEDRVRGMLLKSFGSIFSPLKSSQITEISVGFGNAYYEVDGWCESIKEAKTALTLGDKLYGNGKSYYFNDFGILFAIADGDTKKKADLAMKILERLRDRDLMMTLKSFLEENLNTTDTAEKLGIHRNTVLYRLDQIAYRIGLDPRNFEDAFKIRMALYVREICC